MKPEISIENLGQSPVKPKKVTINDEGKHKSISRLSGTEVSVKTDTKLKRKSTENISDKKTALKQDSILAKSTDKGINKNEPQIKNKRGDS